MKANNNKMKARYYALQQNVSITIILLKINILTCMRIYALQAL